MKNTLSKTHKAKGKFSLFTFLLLSTFCFFFALGCNESLQMGLNHSDSVLVEELMPEATQIIREGLADEDPRVRVNAVEVVAATKRIKLMPKVQRLLKDEFVPVRFAAALAVGDVEYRLAKSSVEQLLKDQDGNVRIAAAYAMGKLGYSKRFELLDKMITSSDQTVRANAALLLGKSGGKKSLKLLYWALQHKDSDDKVIFQSAEAVAMLGDVRIYPKLWTMLISARADDRVMGIKAMGALGTTEAKNALVTMLGDDVLEVRLAAAEQLGVFEDTTGEPVVLDVFTKKLTSGLDKEGLERVNVLTSLAIGGIGTPTLTKFLPQLLENESKLVRIAAAKAVFQCIMSRD